MKNEELCLKLDEFYKSTGIYPNDQFRCKFKEKCSINSDNFTTSKMSYIGREYGNDSTMPKIIFLSLDSGSSRENYNTIEEIRAEVERDSPRKNTTGKGQHWYQTFDLNEIITKPFLKEAVEANYFDKFMCHVNSAKCCQNKKSNNVADNPLFTNCRGYIKDEITLMAPDIVVTQGNKAKEAIEVFPLITSKNFNDAKGSLIVNIREVGSRKMVHIQMYHPAYFKGYWGQKNLLESNLSTILDMVKSIM